MNLDKMVEKCPKDIFEMMVEVRRILHRNPEESFKEYNTANLVEKKLTEFGIEYKKGLAKTGVIGFIGDAKKGRVGALRADIDALSINDAKQVAYRSQIPGIMHACGHDGHTAMLLGASAILAREKERIKGGLKLIFQPAEEASLGATALIEEGVLRNPDVDFIIATHVWPELPVGKVGIQYGTTMSCAGYFKITVKGQATHAGMPHLGIDAMVPAANLVSAIRAYLSQGFAPGEVVTICIGTINGGYKRTVVADKVSLEGTTRTISEEKREVVFTNLERISQHICMAYGAECLIELERGSPASFNNQTIIRTIENTSRDIFGEDGVEIITKIPMTSEDFGRYLKHIPGAMFKLGTSNRAKNITEPLHSILFDLDERALALGAVVMAESALNLLEHEGDFV